ncbi:unnamed protein product [Chironomus riparius]|uniref:C-type lectin domain-containing protein n=1 Tax=Chironomus riparius TaxID=315576 RepID=A0A9N9RUX6_9DIPT|nr:unnamed protein product [Chironomus riparius]
MKFLVFFCAFFFIACYASDEQVAFVNIGSVNGTDSSGVNYQKTFYLPRYFRTTWMLARAMCKSYDLEFASADTLDEATTLVSFVKNNSGYVYVTALIGGLTLTPKSKTDWYWVNSGNKVAYDIPWYVTQPNNYEGKEQCLGIGRGYKDKFDFHDYKCMGEDLTFICQKIEY